MLEKSGFDRGIDFDSIRDGHRVFGDVCSYVYVYVWGTPTLRWKCECVVEIMNLIHIHTEDESSSACVMNLFCVLGFCVYMYRVDLIYMYLHKQTRRGR